MKFTKITKEAFLEGMLHAAHIADLEGSHRSATAIRSVVQVISGTPSREEPVEPLWQGVQGDRISGGMDHSSAPETASDEPQEVKRKDLPKWFRAGDEKKLMRACGESKNLFGRCVCALKKVYTREAFVNNLSPIKGAGAKTEEAIDRFRGMIWEV